MPKDGAQLPTRVIPFLVFRPADEMAIRTTPVLCSVSLMFLFYGVKWW
jgi:hypothetical protein